MILLGIVVVVVVVVVGTVLAVWPQLNPRLIVPASGAQGHGALA